MNFFERKDTNSRHYSICYRNDCSKWITEAFGFVKVHKIVLLLVPDMFSYNFFLGWHVFKANMTTLTWFIVMLSSVYDPLRLAGPFILEGRSIIHKLCQDNFGWDERIPRNIERQWVKWVHRLQRLVSINIPKCYKPLKLGDVKDCSIHHFSDASEKGNG